MIVLILHKHRFIILRRLALILGLLYGYRAVTMFVTNLPKADPTYFCLAKVSVIFDRWTNLENVIKTRLLRYLYLLCYEYFYNQAEDGITLYEVLSRAFSILSGFGLSMNGKHVYCGDYIYSGHTMTIILAHLLIQVTHSNMLTEYEYFFKYYSRTDLKFILISKFMLIFQEYTSKRLWLLHWLTFILAIFGVAFLVVGRGHYTIDIIVAYW